MVAVTGPIEFEHDGVRYPVALTVNSLCSLEDQFGGRSITVLGEDIASGAAGARGVRALFRAALVEGHPEITDRDAGRILTALGADAAGEIIQKAFEKVQSGLDVEIGDLPKVDAKGALAFDVAGERLVLIFGMNAQAELEDYFDGLSPEEIARKIGKREVSLRDLRAMFRAAIIDDRDVSLEAAGKIIDRVGLRVAGRAVAEAFVGAFPEAATEIEGEPEPGNRRQRRAAKANPTKSPRKGGTGKR